MEEPNKRLFKDSQKAFCYCLQQMNETPYIAFLLSARTAMWSMPVVLTETENENDSVNQNYVAKMTLQK